MIKLMGQSLNRGGNLRLLSQICLFLVDEIKIGQILSRGGEKQSMFFSKNNNFVSIDDKIKIKNLDNHFIEEETSYLGDYIGGAKIK